MKKLLLSLILIVVLTVSFATPALADNGKGNMPGVSASFGEWAWQGLNGAIRRIAWGWGWGNGSGIPVGWGISVSVNHAIKNIMLGDPPGQAGW